MAGAALLQDSLAKGGDPGRIAGWVRQLFDLDQMIAVTDTSIPDGGFRSLEHLVRRHDELAIQHQRLCEKRLLDQNIVLPPPPFDGTSEIVPLGTVADLLAEGNAQRNCVASYVRRVAEGKCYIYRLLQPERATFSLVRYARNWELGELSGYANSQLKADTRQTVQAWLASVQPPNPVDDFDDGRLGCTRYEIQEDVPF